MRYYVISDVHSFYSETMQALSEKGFFEDKSPHKLIVCGDLFDRGSESVKMQNFICELLKNDDVILVRGNHEDLILDLIRDAKQLFGYGIEHTHHWSNGTVKTVTDLTGTDVFTDDYRDIINKLFATPYLTEILRNEKICICSRVDTLQQSSRLVCKLLFADRRLARSRRVELERSSVDKRDACIFLRCDGKG